MKAPTVEAKWWQLKKRANWYTCPLLMHVQWLCMLALMRPVYWSNDGALCLRMPKGHGVQVTAWWPTWMVITECWLRNNWWRALARLRRALEAK